MTQIMTVLGPIDPADLGVTYAHDHLLGGPPAWSAEAGQDSDLRLDSIDVACQELALFAQAGGSALIEMSTPDYARDAAGLRRLAEESGIHIVMASGLQKDRFSRKLTEAATVDELAERFTAEIREGVDGGVRCGLLKGATSLNAMTPGEEKLLAAVAIAHRATGAPISTHTEAGTMGLEQIDFLRERGVASERIAIGHVDRRLDYAYHKALLATGAYVIYDQLSKEKYYPDRERVALLKQLIDEGYGERIMLSGDLARRSYWTSYGGGPGFTYILWRFVPWLLSEGVSAEATRRLLVDNPARFFAF